MKKTDMGDAVRSFFARLGRYKYPLLALALGLVILALPTRSTGKEKEAPSPPAALEDAASMEERMEAILSEIEGAGKVRVMLEYAAGEKSIYQSDSEQEVRDDGVENETRTSVRTVLASGENSRDAPVVVQKIYPTFRGALVVSEGADDGNVKLNLVTAVSSLTGLGADKITVIKMKSE